jgi:serine/threonine protein kinase
VRWMSPESLALGVFTPASDVWSFGILLYEIITFGSFPYQGMTNTEVLEYVKMGNTVTIPQGVKTQL